MRKQKLTKGEIHTIKDLLIDNKSELTIQEYCRKELNRHVSIAKILEIKSKTELVPHVPIKKVTKKSIKKKKVKYYIEKKVTNYDWAGVGVIWFLTLMQTFFLWMSTWHYKMNNSGMSIIALMCWAGCTWVLISICISQEEFKTKTKVKEEVNIVEE